MAFYIPLLARNGVELVMLKATSAPDTPGNWADIGEIFRYTGPDDQIVAMYAEQPNYWIESPFFDASDAGPTDPGGVWTNDAGMFNINTSDQSVCSTSGDVNTNYLEGQGTTAPASGATIESVRGWLKMDGSGSGSNAGLRITTDGAAETLFSSESLAITVNTNHYDLGILTEPTGGWTWAKVQALECRMWRVDGSQSMEPSWLSLEIIVSNNKKISVWTIHKNGDVRHHLFDPSIDDWEFNNVIVAQIGDHANYDSLADNPVVTVGTSNIGERLLLFTGHNDATDQDDLFYSTYYLREGAAGVPWYNPTWATISLHTANADNPVCSLGNDASGRIAHMYKTSTGVQARSFQTPARSFGTATLVDSTHDAASIVIGQGIIDSSNQLYFPYADADGKITVVDWASADTPASLTNTTAVSDVAALVELTVEQVADSGDTVTWGTAPSNEKKAQSFSFPEPIILEEIEFYIISVGSPPDNMRVSIQTDASGEPSGTELTHFLLPGSSVPTSKTLLRQKFEKPAYLSSGTTFWFVCERTGALDSLSWYSFYGDIFNGNPYTGGTLSTFSSGTWTTDTDDDMYFSLKSRPFLGAALAVDGTNVHLLYVDEVDQDVHRDSNVAGGGETDTQIRLGVPARYISGSIISGTLEMVWLDNVTTKYYRESLGAFQGPHVGSFMLMGIGY